ncbi:spindle pole body component 110-like [Melanaphis sacchari]|uniref:spindle pole body component 110-like n=1 Tax=Melanaphis sacchari TaxID=742174 RepID=UPI000DC13551|nr:spindle pole body component 110-like [Melanaphis sacchari]
MEKLHGKNSISSLSLKIDMYSEDTSQELKEIISCQKEKIGKLNTKLVEFDEVVSERNNLQKLYKQFEQSNEDSNKKFYKKSFNELLGRCDVISKKFKKAADTEYQWELKCRKLEDDNNGLNRQLRILKFNENKLQSEFAEIETTLKFVQRELCTTKSELEEKNSTINKLKTKLKCNEQELYKVRSDVEGCKIEFKKLNETNGTLNVDLKCTKKSLCDTKLSATRMEKRFMQERENLSNELIKSCKKINDLEIRYDEANCKLNDEKCKSKKFASKLIEMNKVNAKSNLELKNRIQKLQEEICARNNDLCSLNKKVTDLQKENECKCMEISALKNKICEREGQLKQMCLLSETIEQIKCNFKACCSKKFRLDLCKVDT